MDLDKANHSTESNKTLGFTIFDLKLRDSAYIGVPQKYTEGYGSSEVAVTSP